MKTILAFIIAIASTATLAADFSVHADSWRGNDYAPVERVGVSYGSLGLSYSEANKAEQASIEWRQYVGFQNIEIGLMPSLTYGTGEGLTDWRTITVSGDVFAEIKPYVKIGSDVFVIIMNDSTNQNTVRLGFKLF